MGTFDVVAEQLRADPAVKPGKLFGHSCLKTGGKVFVVEHEGDLLLKPPPDRLAELKLAGARDFAPLGHRMNGWVLVAEPAEGAVAAWLDLAEEAKAFVAGAA